MPLIEGVGDEVTVFVGLLFISLILILAWLSTNVNERPHIGVIFVDSRSFFRILERVRNLATRPGVIVLNAIPLGQGDQEPPPQAGGAESEEVIETPSNNESETRLSSQVEQSLSEEIDQIPQDSIPSQPLEVSDSASASNESDTQGSAEGTSSVDEAQAVLTDGQDFDNIELPPEAVREKRLAFFERIASGKPVTTEVSGSSDSSNATKEIQGAETERCQLQEGTLTEETPPPSEPVPESTAPETPELEDRLEGHIRIRLKYLDDRQKLVQARPEETIGDFKRRHFASEMADSLIVRFIYNGHELRQEGQSLQAYNVSDMGVIHCLLSQSRQQQPQTSQRGNSEFDIGMLMLPLFGVILLCVWYFRFSYRSYFNAMSTFSLIGLTFLFLVALLASWRTPEHEHAE